jgi:1-acyl-sn-glycerol-3-phosphate acyltransferase
MSKLSREDYTLENYKALYEHYAEYMPSKRTIQLAATALRAVYNPEVSPLDIETEKVLTEHVENGNPIIYASNHLRMDDQYVLGAGVWAVPILGRNLKQGVIIPAKVDYFNGKSRMPLPMSVLEGLGMMPVFRERDGRGHPTLFKEATEAYLDTCATQLSNGVNMVVSPEGTRNKNDPTRILNLKHGVAKIALKACELGVRPLILPTALSYANTSLKVRGPEVYFGEPIVVTGDETTAHLTGDLQRKLQHAVDVLNS